MINKFCKNRFVSVITPVVYRNQEELISTIYFVCLFFRFFFIFFDTSTLVSVMINIAGLG